MPSPCKSALPRRMRWPQPIGPSCRYCSASSNLENQPTHLAFQPYQGHFISEQKKGFCGVCLQVFPECRPNPTNHLAAFSDILQSTFILVIMNPEWTFSTPSEQLNPCVNSDSMDSIFLDSQDALNPAQWEHISITPNDPCTSFSDMTGCGAHLDTEMEHYGDFTGFCGLSFGDLHGEYGGFFIDNDSLPPLSNLEQGMSSINNITELSVHVPETLQQVEENFTVQDIAQSSIEVGHEGPSMSTEDENSSFQTPLDPRRSYKAPKKQPARRTKISSAAKHILETQFDNNPYPDTDELAHLNKSTGLTMKSIKTWFCNIRSRKARKCM